MQKDRLDGFISSLNRHPGRRVDIAVSAGENPGEVVLDYLVSENRAWVAFAQVSNTGTETTDKVRERIGLVFNQFTNNDDVLELGLPSLLNSMKPTLFLDPTRSLYFPKRSVNLRIFGSWSEISALQLGRNIDIDGESWHSGGELIFGVLQKDGLFVDFSFGAKFENISVTNNNVPGQSGEGESDFVIPRLQLKARKVYTKSQYLSHGRFRTYRQF